MEKLLFLLVNRELVLSMNVRRDCLPSRRKKQMLNSTLEMEILGLR